MTHLHPQDSNATSVTSAKRQVLKSEYLVIRLGDLDRIDVFDEIHGVIIRLGYCWFAKYGRPISTMGRKLEEITLCIVQTRKVKEQHKRRRAFYRIKAMSILPPKRGECPSYYWRVPKRKRTWIKIEPASSFVKRELVDLTVISSCRPLVDAMRELDVLTLLVRRAPSKLRTCPLRDTSWFVALFVPTDQQLGIVVMMGPTTFLSTSAKRSEYGEFLRIRGALI